MRRDLTRGPGACRILIDNGPSYRPAAVVGGLSVNSLASSWAAHGILIPSLAQRTVKRLINSCRTGSKALPGDAHEYAEDHLSNCRTLKVYRWPEPATPPLNSLHHVARNLDRDLFDLFEVRPARKAQIDLEGKVTVGGSIVNQYSINQL